jgi:hypothetical protein
MLSLTMEDYESDHWDINFSEDSHYQFGYAVEDIDKIR